MGILQGLCCYNELLYAAWKGDVGDDRLFYSNFNGTAWASQATIAGNSSVGSALAVLSGSMFAAWKGEPGDERLFFAKYNGHTWTQQAQIAGVASSVGPSLAAFQNKLYAAWKGMGNDQRMWYASFDGTNWSAQAQIPGVASSVGPSLAVFQNKLYAAWKGMGNDQRLWYASFDGSKWSTQAQIPGVASSIGSSLAVFNNKLYAAWKGAGSDQRLWYASFDGTNWSAQAPIPIPVASSIGPALSECRGKLYAMWKGAGSDQRLWYASFDGINWSVQATIPGNTGQDLPQNIGLIMQYQETSEWCWIAVATSINHYYNHSSTLTQCELMTTIGHNINKFPTTTSACPSPAAIAKVQGLTTILANPSTPEAYGVLDKYNSILNIPTEYFKSGGEGDALNVNGNWNTPNMSSMTLAQITTEINAGHPIAVDLNWNDAGAQHVVAIAGVLDDQLLICDPAIGESVIAYESFPSGYQAGASINGYFKTKS